MDPQPPVTPQPTPSPLQPAPVLNDPGEGFGIAGIVLAFFFSPLGLTFSIIGYRKSRAARLTGLLSKVAIIINAVLLGLALLLIPLLVILTLVAYQGVSQRANTSTAETAAADVQKVAESYYADNNAYPTSVAQLHSDPYAQVPSGIIFASAPLDASSDPATVAFYTCGIAGNKIGYWDGADDQVAYVYTGDATENSACTLAP